MADKKLTPQQELRAAIFLAAKPKSLTTMFFGREIELRQPTVRDVLNARKEGDEQTVIVRMLIQYAYAPGTNTHVFEDTDIEPLLDLPFGQDFDNLSKAINKLTGLDDLIEEATSD